VCAGDSSPAHDTDCRKSHAALHAHAPRVCGKENMYTRTAILRALREIADNAWHTGAHDLYESATILAAALSA